MPHRFIRLVAIVIATLAIAAAPVDTRAQSEEADSSVAGRLGGTFASFLDRFGPATGFIDALGPLYTVEGYGMVVVYAEGHVTEEHTDGDARLNRIAISSPRPLDRPATEPNDADWSLDEATARVMELLPADATLAAFRDSDDTQQSAECQSDALTELSAELGARTCRVLLIMPTPDTVSYAMLALAAPDEIAPDAASAAPCAGVIEWIQAAGERLDASESLIAQVDAIDETDPDAATDLRALADGIDALAAEQRASNPPEVMSRANYYLVSAFTGYADAISTAADGVEQADAALVDKAVTTFTEAGEQVALATAELETASDACALQLGTPVASSATPER